MCPRVTKRLTCCLLSPLSSVEVWRPSSALWSSRWGSWRTWWSWPSSASACSPSSACSSSWACCGKSASAAWRTASTPPSAPTRRSSATTELGAPGWTSSPAKVSPQKKKKTWDAYSREVNTMSSAFSESESESVYCQECLHKRGIFFGERCNIWHDKQQSTQQQQCKVCINLSIR